MKTPVYRLVFQFTDESGETHEATAKTQWADGLEDEEKEALLYDPRSPSRAVMLDDLPASLRVDESGNIQLESGGKRLLCLLIPAITVSGHSIYLILRVLF